LFAFRQLQLTVQQRAVSPVPGEYRLVRRVYSLQIY
jgi:hypothetical protein